MRVKIILNWGVVSLGVILGILVLAILAATPPVSFSDDWPVFLSVGFYGCVCLFGSFTGLRNGRRAAAVFLFAVPAWIIFLLWGAYHAYVLTDGFADLPQLFLAVSVPALFGVFWFFTHRAGWNAIFGTQSRTAFRRTLATLRNALLLFVAVSLAAFGLESIATSVGDCGSASSPFVKMRYPGHIAFVAKVLTQGSAGEFPALGLVEKPFWGLHWWERHVVFISGYDFRRGETYFVEGQNSDGLLTQFFPVVGTSHCGQTSLAKESVELRVLRDGVPEGSARIIGIVRSMGSFDPLPNAQVLIKGPAGTVVTTTDAEGIYDSSGMLPGLYRVEIESPNGAGPPCRATDVRSGEAWGCTLLQAPQNDKDE
ncbi:MAG: MSCRAMM family protein [Candidatus Acidiferrales bacterium]